MSKYIEIETKFLVQEDELMSAVFDNIFEGSSSWCGSFYYREGDKEVSVKHECLEDPETFDVDTVTVADIAEAWGKCMAGGFASATLDEWDANDSDNVLQMAIYGEIVFC